ncbi:MAG: DUF1211 domain-containing protein [Bacteroidetes bacterium]|nr:DUF1211 domain-containing protein [Bacteroidota bacterium]
MKKGYNKKEIAFERVLFFSDAVVAIAITLLALELKIEIPEGEHLTFKHLLSPWHQYIAFILSYINIAGFWRTHHDFFIHIKKQDEKLLYLNISWLFFIIVLPFTTSVLSDHFGDTAAIFLYSLNILLLSIFQNFIWDYADSRTDFVDKESLSSQEIYNMRTMLNLDMLNGLVAIAFSFFQPVLAFFLLFFKIPIFLIVPFIIGGKRRKEKKGKVGS